MSIDHTFIEQTKAKIHQWNHELIELEARVKQGVEASDQLQICKQRIVELKSQIDAAQKQLEAQPSS
jgi:small-conductance mechanosensitive channel